MYAIEKLCTSTTRQFGEGLTVWDPKMKRCRVTANGCNYKTPNNPFSQPPYTEQGYYYDAKTYVTNKNLLKFWESGWNPGFYVFKSVAGRNEPVCARGNTLLYQWCEFPRTRQAEGKGYVDVPPFKYTIRDNYKETCIIGPDYCRNRGLDYSDERNNEHCVLSGAQAFGELYFSDSMIRNFRRGT
jgi:hypothetical protein